MIDLRPVRARDWALPLMAAAFFYAVYYSAKTPTVLTLAFYGVTVVLCLWFLINLLHHLASIWTDLYKEKRDVDFLFSQNYLADRIAHMSGDQIKAWRAGMNTIDVFPGISDRGPYYKVGGCECFLYTAWYILCNSTDLHVFPVNRFMTGTYHYDLRGDMSVDDHQQAKNFHQWLYSNGYAMWGRGNTSMNWNNGWNPDKLLEELGISRDEFEDVD